MIGLPRAEVSDCEPVSERSYGIIPIRMIPANTSPEDRPRKLSTANTQVLLIQQKPLIPSHSPFWSFPKGHPEHQDSSEISTAIREVKEETGLVVKEEDILFMDAEGLAERYRNPVKGWVKEVRYWIGLVERQRGDEVEVQEAELAEAKWVSWSEALGLLTFEKGKEILKRAIELLDGGEQGIDNSSDSASVTKLSRPENL